MKRIRMKKRQAGRSLIELMVAMAVGLGMSIAVSALYMASRTSGGVNDSVVEVRSNGRLAVQLLSEQLRMAGYGRYLSSAEGSAFKGSQRTGQNSSGVGYAVNGCDGRFANDQSASAGCGTLSDIRDSIAIAHHATGTTDLDCVGDEAVADTTNGTSIATIVNTYYVAIDHGETGAADDIYTLYCRGGSKAAPVIPGVEQFEVRYGIDSDHDFSIDRVLTATEIREEMAQSSPQFDFSRVQSVEFCLLLRSTRKNPSGDSVNTMDCDGAPVTADGYYRQQFKATVMLRNKTYRP